MRKIVLALAAVAALGLTLPMVTAPAEAHGAKKVVVIKKNHHWNRGNHYGWNKHRHHHRDHGYRQGHRHGATVVIR